MTEHSRHRKHWQLDPDLVFLNHGSFGATPTVVLQAQRKLQDALEQDPIEFLAPERSLEPKLDHVRQIIADRVHADPQDVAFVRNATDAVNAVMRSFPFDVGDELVVTNHGYNACNNAARWAAQRVGAVVREAKIPFPIESADEVVAAIQAELTDRTRLLLVDHVTSATGLVLPIQRIITMAKSRGIQVMIDGAHAPGMVSVDLKSLAADYYTANHHKWLCGPKASGFLWVQREHQDAVRPTVISHAANRPRPNRSRFVAEFDWIGTYDVTPILAMQSAIEFLETLLPGGLTEWMQANRQLALDARQLLIDALNIQPPAPIEMIGSLVTLPLPIPSRKGDEKNSVDIDPLQSLLYHQHRIEVPVFVGPETAPRLIRISAQAYNHISEYEQLAEILSQHS
ncbi:MAG: aminotransferase class V-fold PLP-dependent enzyme [Pirellulaceae bacterium]|nr:aminotransferase class V-fold PLP-dependent enzyme [Pirellulaceae bacterium]